MLVTLDDLRRFAVARSLFPRTTLRRALERMAFVQADPIRAPARAQDLTLRQRVKNYHAGDLERQYVKLGIEEDIFITYGFVTGGLQSLMHPRRHPWRVARRRKAELLLDFVRQAGEAHPAAVDHHFSYGRVTNYWGGSSKATTQLLEEMHYRGMLRVARRERGMRIYAAQQPGQEPGDAGMRRARIDALVDAAANLYAPLPGTRLGPLIARLRYAVPQWRGELKGALRRAKERLAHQTVDGHEWYWPAGEDPVQSAAPNAVRMLAPFDPVVWDRARFEMLWGWAYRFEAYTPAPKRKLGYYALPLLWRDRVIGWANLAVKNGELKSEFGYVAGAPPDAAFRAELEAEVERMRIFLRGGNAGEGNSTIG